MMDIERTVEMFVDVHGHSRLKNLFMYACCFQDQTTDPRHNALIKTFPKILASKSSLFSIN